MLKREIKSRQVRIVLRQSMIKLISVADFISIINACFGFLAIIMAFLGEMRFSFSFIFIASLADGLDGIIARKTRHGELGEYLEAMADMISLSTGPAIFVYIIYHEAVSSDLYYHGLLFITLFVFFSFSILRLASFHIIKDNNFFIGLPASVGTILIIILAFLKIEIVYILPVIFIISFTMVSSVRFPKPGPKIYAIAAILIISILILGKNYYGIAPVLLIISLLVYIILGPIYLKKNNG